MPFLDRARFELVPGTGLVELLEDLGYQDAQGRVITCPARMRTDLASVPRIARSFALPWQQTARAGVLHDGLYRWHEEWAIPRREADALYYEALITDGAPRWRAWGQWSGVRAGGWGAWARWREARQLESVALVPPPIG